MFTWLCVPQSRKQTSFFVRSKEEVAKSDCRAYQSPFSYPSGTRGLLGLTGVTPTSPTPAPSQEAHRRAQPTWKCGLRQRGAEGLWCPGAALMHEHRCKVTPSLIYPRVTRPWSAIWVGLPLAGLPRSLWQMPVSNAIQEIPTQ